LCQEQMKKRKVIRAMPGKTQKLQTRFQEQKKWTKIIYIGLGGYEGKSTPRHHWRPSGGGKERGEGQRTEWLFFI